MRGGRVGTLAASPTLVGAVTVLVVVVAVFLSYQANQGLPFVPTYKLSAEIPNANTMVPGNEVRIGGIRVGQIKAIEPIAHDDGTQTAKVDMELNQDLEPLPDDSTVVVRSRSALGLKYLDIRRGNSSQGFEAGATMPLSAAIPSPVEIDEVFNTFDDPTRAAIQANLVEFGTALAGRGESLNATIGELRPLVERLEPVMRNLSSPQTGLSGFISGLSAAAAEAAPVAQVQGQLFVDLDTTFRAFADVARPFIQETISKSPVTEDVTIATLPKIRPFLANTTKLFSELRPGFHAIRPPISKDIAGAVVQGVKALRLAPAFNNQLDPTATALLNFNNNPNVRQGLTSLDTFAGELQPLLAFVTPAQSVCNYGSLLFRNITSSIQLGNGQANFQRFIVLGPPEAPQSELGPSSQFANGNGDPTGVNFLHFNPYPNTAAPGQERECEAGNEGYIVGQPVIGNVPGNQGTNTAEQIIAEDVTPNKKKKKKKKKGKK